MCSFVALTFLDRYYFKGTLFYLVPLTIGANLGERLFTLSSSFSHKSGAIWLLCMFTHPLHIVKLFKKYINKNQLSTYNNGSFYWPKTRHEFNVE